MGFRLLARGTGCWPLLRSTFQRQKSVEASFLKREHVINGLPVKYHCSEPAVGCTQHLARALRRSAEPVRGRLRRCLKSQPGLGPRAVFSPQNSPSGANGCAWALRGEAALGFGGGPRPCRRRRPALLLSNAGWSQQPTVNMAPGRLQHAALRAPGRPRAGEWSREATPSTDMAPAWLQTPREQSQ